MRVNKLSFCTSKLDLFFHDVLLGSATGFIYKYGQSIALVSNWHVFSGINPITHNVRHSTGYRPNRVEFNINIANRQEGSVFLRAERAPLVVDGESKWWQHNGYIDESGETKIVDIGVFILNEHIKDFDKIEDNILSVPAQVIVNLGETDETMTYEHGCPRVASDVFILGYPKGLTKQGVVPVWKRGTIASEPLFNLTGNIPAILVDAVTREGMSGSPVFYFGGDITTASGAAGPLPYPGQEPWLVGVYAGRDGVTGDEIDMALGRVWRKQLLDEIFYHQIPGGSSSAQEEKILL
jgi:hypothetical protein